jgi:hypothetical protein
MSRPAALTLCFRLSSLVLVHTALCQEAKPTLVGAALVLKPQLAFSDYVSGAPLPPDGFGGDAYADQLESVASQQLLRRGVGVLDNNQIPLRIVNEVVLKLESETSRLARGVVSEQACDYVKQLSTLEQFESRAPFVLAQDLKARLKPDANGAWAVRLYGLRPQMTLLVLQVALLSGRTGQMVWRDQAVLRELPKPHSPVFEKLTSAVYKTLPMTIFR